MKGARVLASKQTLFLRTVFLHFHFTAGVQVGPCATKPCARTDTRQQCT